MCAHVSTTPPRGTSVPMKYFMFDVMMIMAAPVVKPLRAGSGMSDVTAPRRKTAMAA